MDSLRVDLRYPNKVSKLQLQELVDFLDSEKLGSQQFMWTCPISKAYVGIRLERMERQLGDYYREPYPVFLTPVYHNVPYSPQITIRLNDSMAKSLRAEWVNNLTTM